MVTIENFTRLSLQNLNRKGFLKQDCKGTISWSKEGNVFASIGVSLSITNDLPCMELKYIANGAKICDNIKLKKVQSNLIEGKGYWMFVCPITQKPCRYLYLVNSHFISHRAMIGIHYKCQADSKDKFYNLSKYFKIHDDLCDMIDQVDTPRTKTHYKGKDTRLIKRIIKKGNKIGILKVEVDKYW
jgi:hypothetical protein